jgi:hypothetical protein
VVSGPRGILSAVNMQALNWAINAELYQSPVTESVILLNVPLFHVTGTHVIFLPSFVHGRRIVIMCVSACGPVRTPVPPHRCSTGALPSQCSCGTGVVDVVALHCCAGTSGMLWRR